jgi:predicted RNA-binding protein Jag
LVEDDHGIDIQKKGLEIINKKLCIKTVEPTREEQEDIKNTIIELQKEVHISYKDFLTKIFNDLKIDSLCRKKFEKSLVDAEIEKFDKDATIDFIKTNKRFFCK